MLSSDDIKVFSGSSVPKLGREICRDLGIEPGEWKLLPRRGKRNWYSNGCFELELEDNCRGRHVFIIQTSVPDFHTLHLQLFELFQLVMAASKSAAKKITVIMPYLSYARSDKKTGRMPIVGKMIPAFLEELGMDHFIGIEFHSSQYELAFDCSTNVDSPTVFPQIIEYLKDLAWKNENAIVLPGDEGSREMAEQAAEALHLDVGTVEKERRSDSEVVIKNIKGNVEKKKVVIVDDEICRASTTRAVAEKAVELGAQKEITIAAVHALFTADAVEKLQFPPIKKIIITNTVPAYQRIDPEALPLDVLSVGPFLSNAIKEIRHKGSVSKLYEIPPSLTLDKTNWELNPKFKEILSLEDKIGGNWLKFLETVGINSKVMDEDLFGPYRNLLKLIAKEEGL